jgi:hypothetical protein
MSNDDVNRMTVEGIADIFGGSSNVPTLAHTEVVDFCPSPLHKDGSYGDSAFQRNKSFAR